MSRIVHPDRRRAGFLAVLALAHVGGVTAYLPLLTLLLPMRVEALAGEARLGVFTATVIVGAVAASGANILFGWLSDRWVAAGGGRRVWLAGGVAATVLGHAAVAAAASPTMLVVAVALFQTGVNALLAPLFAIMADETGDRQKGLMGALLALGQPAAAGMVAVVASMETRAPYAVLSMVVAACALPLLLTRAQAAASGDPPPEPIAMGRRDLGAAWFARLLVQVAANVLFFYLFYYLGSKAPDLPAEAIAGRMGSVMIVAYLAPLPVALLLGQLASRTGRTRSLLLGAAALSATGLAGMALARGFAEAAVAFCVFAVGSSVFQSLQTAFAMRLLPSARHRGRDLGLFNLANTLPALIGPLLTWTLATPHDFRLLLLVLAGLTLAGGIVMPRAPQRAGAAQ